MKTTFKSIVNKPLAALFCAMFMPFSPLAAHETEVQYLSGTGLGDTRTWRFLCSDGMRSGRWSNIEVPSQWELQGFGAYTFGRFYLDKAARPSSETGTYRLAFKVPAAWRDKSVELVFEGVMTDTEAFINGKSAGSVHRGSFYRFSYDVSDKLNYGKKNQMEVIVHKESADKTVNAAERRADWWLFGGIYRPVYLVAKPKTSIKRIAVDARADGSLRVVLYTRGLKSGCKAALSVESLDGRQQFPRRVVPLSAVEKQDVSTRWESIQPWNCEHPNLYNLKIELLAPDGRTLHVHRERVGFRTVEFREQDGFYVNGTKIVLKGINRHCFHPDGGRTTNKETSISDVELIKSMNMNAIRSHYSPDRHLLDVCDSLGVFYLDEFTGWHGKYGTAVGEKLLEEFIAADCNHPSVIIWGNGNEGGWNKNLDHRFAELDPQRRHVVHAWADFNGVDTHHYPAYQTGTGRLANGYKVFMPTEFLHSQYDKGGGAGLEDFWNNYSRNPMFAGGFIWTFVDEAVRRTDRGGELDSDGPNGPDGIVGPYREKEGSYYTIREVWSPVQFAPMVINKSFRGELLVSNSFLFTNLSECSMKYRVWAAPSTLKALSGASDSTQRLIAEGNLTLPDAAPGETARARMTLPEKFFDADILEIEVFDNHGRSICNRTWPIHTAAEYFAGQQLPTSEKTLPEAEISKNGEQTTLSATGVQVLFNTANGCITTVKSHGRVLPLSGGPLPVGMKAVLKNCSARQDGQDAVLTFKYVGAVDSIVWRMKPCGLLSMQAVMLNRGNGGGFDGAFFDTPVYNFGLTFTLPEEHVKGMRWMGRGPYRVWRNRIPGANYGIWQKQYNNTVTGESFERLVYPEFKGYHANMYWATVSTDAAPFTVYSETDGIYLRMLTPEEPQRRRNGEDTMRPFPEGDISFLYEIPAMRSFKTISEHGPQSQPSTIRIKQGDDGLHMRLWFDFRPGLKQ